MTEITEQYNRKSKTCQIEYWNLFDNIGEDNKDNLLETSNIVTHKHKIDECIIWTSPSQNFSKTSNYFQLCREKNHTSSRHKKTPKNKVFFWWFFFKINLTSLNI